MAASVETRFNDMPFKLQKEVLVLLNGKDISSSRLVCIKWFRMLSSIHPLRGFLNSSQDLQLLKNSYYVWVGRLSVIAFTDNLPIYSSKRCEIPKAKDLSVEDMSSKENAMKLLRSYAKCSTDLFLGYKSLAKIEPYLLKGLAYEFLSSLGIQLQFPSIFFEDFDKRNHLIALIQFLETTKLPNLQAFSCISFGRLENENHLITKFIQAINSFFEKHGPKFTKLGFLFLPLTMVAKCFKHAPNLQHLNLGFDNVTYQEDEINVVRESLKHIKKLTFLCCKDLFCDSVETSQFHFDLIQAILRENRKSIKTFNLLSWNDTRMDWLPINCELALTEVIFNFHGSNRALSNETNITPSVSQDSKLITKLVLRIFVSPFHSWMSQIYPWMISTFPNLTNLVLDIPIQLNLLDFRKILCNLVNLQKMLIPRFLYSAMSQEAREWFKIQTQFIKSAEIRDELMIRITRPFPNNIFDRN